MMIVEPARGRIISLDENGAMIHVPPELIDYDRLYEWQSGYALVAFQDSRSKSDEQRGLAFLLIGEIANWNGDTPEDMYQEMLRRFNIERWERLGPLYRKIKGVSVMSVTIMRAFITMLIRFCIEWDVPCGFPLYEKCEDLEHYTYCCLKYKKCAVCGSVRVDLHHFDQIGFGKNRDKVYQIGMRVISLCRECHGKAHSYGKTWLTEELHLVPIPLTVEIGRIYHLTAKNLGKEKAG